MATSTTNLVVAVLLLSSCLAFSRSEEVDDGFEKCPPFPCGKFGNLTYPFEDMTQHKKCGFFSVDGCNETVPKFQFANGTGNWYDLLDIYPNKTIHVRDQELERHLRNSTRHRSCHAFNNLNPLYSSLNLPFTPIRIYPTIDLLRCNHTADVPPPPHLADFRNLTCGEYNIYYTSKPLQGFQLQSCSIIQLPAANQTGDSSISNEWWLHRIASDFFLESPDGFCQYASDKKFQCAGNGGNQRIKLWIGLGIGCSAVVAMMICGTVFIVRRYCQKSASSGFRFMEKNSHLSSNLDFERDSAYFGVPIFAYSELEEATNYFHPTRELGDGGYGTVYYGELRDGREVAVKRLYENNYKLVQQFINEIKIITQLCHKNLVTLYGCTSRHCRELLLVYEFIPNGTVADHLRGDRATLAWPIRLRIATETANALTFLHASGIIHRDIKTSNILLDNHFSVKVADFGLSRFFPTDVTHVSTAPQGTPGYVDPEYHQCYQLTEKSDVYSFGVVLIQLITSLPAVDISRKRDEINLASFAVNRIQNGEFSDYLDPCLFLGSDMAGRRMVTLVAELAFQCLQSDRDHRPSMEEVLRFLKSIGGELDGAEVGAPVDDNSAMALKGNFKTWSESHVGVSSKGTHSPTSPISVSYMSCCSGSTTASSSFTHY